jgi:hypothetical protein
LTFRPGCGIMVFIMEKFVQLREVLHPSGVYALIRLEKVVYVGKSLNLFARLSKHYTNLTRKRSGKPPYSNAAGPVIDFDDVMVKFCPVDVLDKEEVKLIQQYLPEHNTQHNVVPRDLTHIPAFQELLRKARLKEGPTIARRPFGYALRPLRRPKVVILPVGRVG